MAYYKIPVKAKHAWLHEQLLLWIELEVKEQILLEKKVINSN